MTIVNKETEGNKPYEILLGTGTEHPAEFTAYASNPQEALNIVADYLVDKNRINLYHRSDDLEMIAQCSRWKTAAAFAIDHNLHRCGSHNIYVEIISITGNDWIDDLRMEQREQM